jgi:hypothetical protein
MTVPVANTITVPAVEADLGSLCASGATTTT